MDMKYSLQIITTRGLLQILKAHAKFIRSVKFLDIVCDTFQTTIDIFQDLSIVLNHKI